MPDSLNTSTVVLLGGSVLLCATATFFLRLSARLIGPHPCSSQGALTPEIANDGKDTQSYKDINMLDAIPPNATHEGYAIIGGSGFVGRFVCTPHSPQSHPHHSVRSHVARLLLLRGETSIRLIDIQPPKDHLVPDHPAISFIKADITSPSSIRAALTTPFPATGKPPAVIYLTAAVIRFWERAAYCKSASTRVNVDGTANVISAIKQGLPAGTMLIYTSSGNAAIPRALFFRFGAYGDPNKPVTIGDDTVFDPFRLHTSWYAKSKREAEKLVIEADADGIPSGILRPAQYVSWIPLTYTRQ